MNEQPGEKHFIRNSLVWLFYLIIIGLFLLQQPLQGSLMGNWDNWLYLFLFNYYPDYFIAHFLNEPVYSPFYPDVYPAFMYGEPSFFSALIYLPFQWLLDSKLWAYYIFSSIILSLNAFSVYILYKQLFNNYKYSIAAGLIFVFSNFILCSLDQQNVLSIYPSLLSVYFIISAAKKDKPYLLLLASFFAGIQVYCSGYNFLFTGVVWGLLAIVHYAKLLEWLRKPVFWIAIISLVVYIAPFFFIYFLGGLKGNSINTVSNDILIQLSLHADNFFQAHPYNIIYGNRTDSNLLHYIGAVGIGCMFIVLCFTGLIYIKSTKFRATFILIIMSGILLAFGPVWNFGGFSFDSPIFLILKSVQLDQYMRTPIRAFMISLVPICIVSTYAMEMIFARNRYLGLAVVFLWCIENIPFKLQKFQSSLYLDVPHLVQEAADKLDSDQALWILPSTIHQQITMPPGLGEINREYIYMYWQTRFKKNMINGMNGYYPKATMLYRELNKDKAVSNEYLQVYLKEMEFQ